MIKFKPYWKHYIVQSACATLGIFVVLLVCSLEQMVIVASIGATTFIVFDMPDSITANTRNIVGGHLIGLAMGSLWNLIPHGSTLVATILYALAVGSTMLIMVIVDAEHPPAAGTALGIALSGFSWEAAIALITSTVLLAFIHRLFKPYLRDLV